MESVSWELVGIGLDFGITLLLYRLYKKNMEEADAIKVLPSFEVGPDLESYVNSSPDQIADYVGVKGVTESIATPIKSTHADEEGVIQNLFLVEHRAKRMQGYWSDAMKVLRDTTNTVPFVLSNRYSISSVMVHVQEPLEADFLMDNMKVVYDHFEPSNAGLLEKGMDRIFGDVSKGFQEKEKMLGVGVPVIGIGKVVMDDGRLALMPPSDGRRYILTTLSKYEVIKSLASQAKVIKFLAVIFGGIGAIWAAVFLYKKTSAYYERRKFKLQLQEVRAATRNRVVPTRQRQDSSGDEDEGVFDNRNCVICLNQPREVVALDCGHISMCASCAELLPDPKKCPICRAELLRFVPTFVP